MKKAVALLSVLLAVSLVCNMVLLSQRREDRKQIQNLESANTNAVLSVLVDCERYAQQLDGQEPLGISFLSILGERLGAVLEAPAVQTLLDSCPGSGVYSIRTDVLSGETTLPFAFSTLQQAVISLSYGEDGGRRQLVRQAFSLLAGSFGQALSSCGLSGSSVLNWTDYPNIYQALIPLLEPSLSPGGELYSVVEQLNQL